MMLRLGTLLLLPALLGCASRYERSADREGDRIMQEGEASVDAFRTNLVRPTADVPAREDRAPPVDVPETLTLEDALRIATGCNRDYKTQRDAFFLAALSLGLTRRNFEQWVFTGSLSNNLTDGEEIPLFETTALAFTGTRAVLPTGASLTISGALTQVHQPDPETTVTGSASFTQPLLRGAGKSIAWEPLTLAERGLVYQARSFEIYRQGFTISIIQQYANLVSQQRSVKNAENRVASNDYVQRQAKALFRLEMGTQTDVFRAEREYRNAQNSLLDAQQGYQLALDQFKITLGLPLSATFDVVDDIPLPEDLDPPIEGAVEAALANRLDLVTARQQTEDAERGVRVARNALLPDLDFTASYNGIAAGNTLAEFGFEPSNWEFGLSLEIPLDRKAERNAYKSALIAYEQSKRSLQQTEDNAILSVRDALRRLKQTRLQIQNDKDNIKTIERLLLKADLENRAGRGSNRDVVEATNDLADAKNSLNDRYVSYLIDTLNLQQQMGLLFVDKEGRVVR
ncbi:MAG TPA: TolC family protein [Planctomycetota bacterium]|nr:TolC family protein [Planctomycetota bacterium]